MPILINCAGCGAKFLANNNNDYKVCSERCRRAVKRNLSEESMGVNELMCKRIGISSKKEWDEFYRQWKGYTGRIDYYGAVPVRNQRAHKQTGINHGSE